MKRQRSPTPVKLDISLPDVWYFLQNASLNADQLHALGTEITRLYAIQANAVIQHFPSELLQSILCHAIPPIQDLEQAEGIRLWLSLRTISRSWCASLSKMDFSLLNPSPYGFKTTSLLEIFPYFSHLRLGPRQEAVDLSLLTKVKNISLSAPHCIKWERESDIAQLTQLTGLSLAGKNILQNPTLLLLTNLQFLDLASAKNIKEIHTLTNLESLVLRWGAGHLDQSTIEQSLTKLTSLTAHQPSFFKHGVGTSFPDGGDSASRKYTGQWLKGQPHGYGVCEDSHLVPGASLNAYEGEWSHGRRHGVGRMTFTRPRMIGPPVVTNVYTGNWEKGQINGHGHCLHSNGDSYLGEWTKGRRNGSGVYTFADGTKVEGTWSFGHLVRIAGQKVITIPNEFWEPKVPPNSLENWDSSSTISEDSSLSSSSPDPDSETSSDD